MDVSCVPPGRVQRTVCNISGGHRPPAIGPSGPEPCLTPILLVAALECQSAGGQLPDDHGDSQRDAPVGKQLDPPTLEPIDEPP